MSLLVKVKDRSVLDWKTTEVVKQLTRMIATGATPHTIGEIVMEDAHLRDAVKAVLLRDVDDQCKQLCKKSDESSSVLRVPRPQHKVILFIVHPLFVTFKIYSPMLWIPVNMSLQ